MARKKPKAESEEDSPSSEEQEYEGQANPKKKGKTSAPKKPITKTTPLKKPSRLTTSPKKEQKSKKIDSKEKDDSKLDFLPGQKYPTPDEEDGACAFYKSLYEKNPQSEMARKYCLEYGVLEEHEAARLVKQMQKQKK